MLESFYIKNFRLFKFLELKKLSNVNLIAGKNNSGKSCLLEALQVYAANAAPRVLYDLIVERGQHWEYELNTSEDENMLINPNAHPLRHLFNGYQFSFTDAIELGSAPQNQDKLKIMASLYKHTETDHHLEKIVHPSKDDFYAEDVEPMLIAMEAAGEVNLLTRLTLDFKDYRRYLYRTETIYKFIVQIVPTQNLNDETMLRLWNKINIKPNLRQEVFKAIQLIDANVQEIVINADKRGRANAILIYSDELQLPLKSLGAGMTHLLHIILALINAKDGLLLIDEFENGLHYTVHTQLWELIFILSQKLNVQVFATTHSRDAIASFHEIWQQHPDWGTYHRLDIYAKGIQVMPYDCEELHDALAVNGEMR